MLTGSFTGKVPPGPQGIRLLTLLFAMRKNPLGFVTEAAHRYGEVVFLGWGDKRVYFLNYPSYIKQVLSDKPANYAKDPRVARIKPLFGDGLTTSEGALWRRQHQMIQPFFHLKRIAALAPLITAVTAKRLEHWQRAAAAGDRLDIALEMRELTQAIILRVLFGQDLPDSKAKAIGQALRFALDHINHRVWALFDFSSLPTRKNRLFLHHLRTLDRFVYHNITEHGRNPAVSDDLLALLIGAQAGEHGEAMSDPQLRDEAMTLFVAGHTTMAAGLAWTWYLLAKHPAVEERLVKELQGVLGGRDPTFEDLATLPLTRRVIEEALRLYPPTWIISRYSLSDDEIGGYPVRAHSAVLISPYVLHRNPTFWDHPEEFDPERFTPERSANRPSYSYLPFGGGPRVCLGKAWALMQMQLILAMVAQRYRLKLAPGCLVRPETSIMLCPQGGLMMTVH